ncbi:isocitrate lyase/phosphoenolpyruvate mutase family protein [Deinococcus multiflagellatus]|nr:isocitrate lyase/phosphoenolpyruvate mutase family protein [Deinococcus multiflagellatus]MBZ9713923.1 isocitrate lyase/phosphoenolpyruvate mutase family protein [Deinococcus multiflagellatus]
MTLESLQPSPPSLTETAARAGHLRALHASGLVLPNAWDALTAELRTVEGTSPQPS